MRSTLAHLLLVFLVALAIKLSYVHERLGLPDVNHPVLDSLFHDEWAKGLAFDEWTPDQARLQHEPYFRAPLYAYFVSVVYRAFGTSPQALFRVQAVLGALTVVLTFCFCAIVFGRPTAWVAALIQITYWPFTYHEAERLIPALSLLLDLAFLLALLVAGRRNQRRYAVAAGIAAGLAALARPSILITLPFALWWLATRSRPRGWLQAGIVLAATLMVIAPATLRNVIRGHDLVVIASQGGVNFFIGNNPQSNGVRAVVPGTRADWWGGYYDTRRIAEQGMKRSLKASEVSGYWYRRGIEFLVRQPQDAFRLYARKTGLILGNAEPSNERQLHFRRKQSKILSVLRGNFAFILAAAVAGIWSIARRPRNAPRHESLLPVILAVAYAAGVVAFFVTSRFRLPVVMFLIPLSAAGCVTIARSFQLKAWREATAKLTLAAVVFAASMANPFEIGKVADARGLYEMGVDQYREGNYQDAIDALDRALEEDSTYAPSWAMRGRVHERLQDYPRAVTDLRKACALDLTFADAFYWLGVTYQEAGQHVLAEREYLRVLALDDTRVEPYTNLADICFRAGRKDDAFVFLQKALAIDSTYVNAIYGMGYYHELARDLEKAAAAYRRALPFPPARIGLARIGQD